MNGIKPVRRMPPLPSGRVSHRNVCGIGVGDDGMAVMYAIGIGVGSKDC
jgi:hypothetical protein